jgi:trehalose 6-phosphate phosphatase
MFQISGARLQIWKSAVRQAERLLAPLVQKYPGCLLENKGLDLSLHYRLVGLRQTNVLIREAQASVRHLPLAAKAGKKVLEFRPADGGDKGQAVKKLASNLARGWKQTGCCLYVGDDSTDEDAFKVIRKMGKRAIAVKVGSGTTCAQYRLFGQDEVVKLLKLLTGANNDKK